MTETQVQTTDDKLGEIIQDLRSLQAPIDPKRDHSLPYHLRLAIAHLTVARTIVKRRRSRAARRRLQTSSR